MFRSGWMALLAVLALGACNGGGEDQGAATAGDSPSLLSRLAGGERAQDFAELPKGEWSELTRQLTDARDLDAAMAATREVLARGGIATRDGERELTAAHAPAASFAVTPREVEHMAVEARARGVRARLDVAEFAQMLASFGWAFPNGPRSADAGKPDPDIEDEYTRELRREALREEARAQQVARDATDDEQKAWADSVMAAPNARHDAARERIDAVNAAVRAASTREEKAALAGEVQAARDELAAARKAASEARAILREGQDARRAQREMANDSRRLHELYLRKVGPSYGAGEDFQAALERWVQAAAKAPEDPASFVPLFITEMARLQDPPIDLADPMRRPLGRAGSDLPVKGLGPRSRQTRLSLLEMQLIVAAFDRDGGTGNDKALAASFQEAIEADAKDGVSEALALAGRVARIASMPKAREMDQGAEPIKVHRPVDDRLQVVFTTNSDEEAARYHWQLVAGAPVHGTWSRRNNDFRFEGQSRQSGKPVFVVDIKQEKAHQGSEARGYLTAVAGEEDPDAPSLDEWKQVANRSFQRSPEELAAMIDEQYSGNNRGFQRSAEELKADMAGETGVGTRSFQRSSEELSDMLAAWLKETSTPRAYASVEVSYHCANPTTIHLYVTNPVADGRGDLGEACTYTFATREAFEQWRDATGY